MILLRWWEGLKEGLCVIMVHLQSMMNCFCLYDPLVVATTILATTTTILVLLRLLCATDPSRSVLLVAIVAAATEYLDAT